MATTTNYGWTKPAVGGDTGSWGTTLNTDLDSIDADLKTVSDAANAAVVPATGAVTATKTGTVGSLDEYTLSLDFSAAKSVYVVTLPTQTGTTATLALSATNVADVLTGSGMATRVLFIVPSGSYTEVSFTTGTLSTGTLLWIAPIPGGVTVGTSPEAVAVPINSSTAVVAEAVIYL